MSKIVWFALYLLVFWSIVVFIIFVNSIPFNPFNQKYNVQTYHVLPEGFGFFTRNPREPSIYIYKMTGDNLSPISTRSSEPSNLFGLSRKGRKYNTEIGYIMNQIESNTWQIGDSTRFILSCDSSVNVSLNKVKSKSFSGKYLVVLQERIPWAWFEDKNIVMPYKKKIVNVK